MASDDAEKRPTMKTAEDLVEQCGGNKLVKKVLIANNGISAVKVLFFFFCFFGGGGGMCFFFSYIGFIM